MDRYTTNLSATFRVVNRQEVNYTWMCVIIGFSVFGLPTAADHNQDYSTSKSHKLKGLYPNKETCVTANVYDETYRCSTDHPI